MPISYHQDRYFSIGLIAATSDEQWLTKKDPGLPHGSPGLFLNQSNQPSVFFVTWFEKDEYPLSDVFLTAALMEYEVSEDRPVRFMV